MPETKNGGWVLDGVEEGNPFDVEKYSPDQPRDEQGRWTDAGGGGGGVAVDSGGTATAPGEYGYAVLPRGEALDEGTVYTRDVNEALKALAEGRRVELNQPREVSTLIDKLAQIGQDARDRGEKAPFYDLCKVSVRGTNLFCAQTMGVERAKMPQLTGTPAPGSVADGMPRNMFGEVDAGQRFIEHVQGLGVPVITTKEDAKYLRASQRELNGVTVAVLTKSFIDGTLPVQPVFVSADNYIIDGHHRWAAHAAAELALGRKVEMPIHRVGMSIMRTLDVANKFADSMGLSQVSGLQSQQFHAKKRWDAAAAMLELLKYSEDQPRDEGGRWTSGGGGAQRPAGAQPSTNARAAAERAASRGDGLFQGVAKDDRPREVEPTEKEREGVALGKIYLHRCYDQAARYVALDVEPGSREATLVHGTIRVGGVTMQVGGTGPLDDPPGEVRIGGADIGHAWVELPGGKVFDGVQGRFYDRDSYYQKMGARAEHKYTEDEARRMLLKTMNFGPWERTTGILRGKGGEATQWKE